VLDAFRTRILKDIKKKNRKDYFAYWEEKMFKQVSVYCFTLATGIALLFLGGCGSVSVRSSSGGEEPHVHKQKKGPPAHAPAHGYRKKNSYHYYPSSHVYYDTGRKVYFYMDAGNWEFGVSLPSRYRIDIGEAVSIEMDTRTPYVEFEQHKIKYPSGKSGKSKGKGKGRGKGKKK
jgi:hypothetical protein